MMAKVVDGSFKAVVVVSWPCADQGVNAKKGFNILGYGKLIKRRSVPETSGDRRALGQKVDGLAVKTYLQQWFLSFHGWTSSRIIDGLHVRTFMVAGRVRKACNDSWK